MFCRHGLLDEKRGTAMPGQIETVGEPLPRMVFHAKRRRSMVEWKFLMLIIPFNR
jgi:hypothetical protein